MPEQPTVTLADIARLAGGVTVPAVANWRKRFSDFPQPLATQGRTPLFDKHAVVAWLTANNKLGSSTPTVDEATWHIAEAIRGVGPLDILRAVFNGTGSPDNEGAPEPRRILAKYRELSDAFGEATVVETLLERAPRAAGRQLAEFATPPTLLALLSVIADTPEHAAIYDPCVGFGSTLAAIATPTSVLYGQEIDSLAAAVAQRRLELRGHRVSIEVGDTIHHDALPAVLADRIVASPPINLMLDNRVNADDARWIIGVPTRSRSDLAFTQIVLAHLKPHGRAIIHLGLNTLTGTDNSLREYLVRNNLLDAVFVLPAGYVGSSSIQSCLVVIDRNRPPSTAQQQTPILLAGLPPTSSDDQQRSTAAQAVVEGYIDLWRRWEHQPINDDFARTVTLRELAANDFNLHPARYLATIDWPRLPSQPNTQANDPVSEELDVVNHQLSTTLAALNPAPMPPVGHTVTTILFSLRQLEQRGQLQFRFGTVRPGDRTDPRTITARDIAQQGITWQNIATPDQQPDDPALTQLGDVLVVTRGPALNGLQQVGRVTSDWHGRRLSPNVVSLRVLPHHNPLITADYLYFWLVSPLFSHHLRTNVAGAMLPSISRNNLRAFEIPVCDLATQTDLTQQLTHLGIETTATLDQLHQALKLVNRRSELFIELAAVRLLSARP